MSNVVQFFPYSTTTELSLELSTFDDPSTGVMIRAVELFGNSDSTPSSNDESVVAGYDVSSIAWSKLGFQITARLPHADRERIVADESQLKTDTTFVALLTCTATKFRHGIRLRYVRDDEWSGAAIIQRNDVKGVVSIRPQLVRNSTVTSALDPLMATERGSLIGTGESITLYVDAAPPSVLASSVSITWEDFANADNVWRREHSEDVFHLEAFSSEPRLYLNSGFVQFREILDSKAKRGPQAVLRDLTATMIAQSVLLQLSMAAITALENDPDSGSVNVGTGWRADLLASILPQLYPDEIDADVRLLRVVEEVGDGDGASSVVSRLGSIVQSMLATFQVIEATVRVYESSRDLADLSND